MSVEEMKIAVHKSIDTLSEEQLKMVNAYIENINNSNVASTFLQAAELVIKERESVLFKLSQ